MTINDWQLLLMSALPVTELRATIPLAVAMGVAPWRAFFLAVAGNLLPIAPIMLLLDPLGNRLASFPVLYGMFQKLLTKTRQKDGTIRKYGLLGLLLFVAVPLPGTGAWSGAILAWLLGLPLVSSILAIAAGVVLAGVFVTLASMGVIRMAVWYAPEYSLLAVLLGFLCLLWYRKRKRNRS